MSPRHSPGSHPPVTGIVDYRGVCAVLARQVRTGAGEVRFGVALAREGYRWRDVVPTDVLDAVTWPGLWRLAPGKLGIAAGEVVRSASRHVFARSLARLVPGITAADLVPSPAATASLEIARHLESLLV